MSVASQDSVISRLLIVFVKDRVYADNPQTLDQPKANIRDAIVEIMTEMCRKVIENKIKRIKACKRCHVGHLNDIVFQV